ncbi:hypothetical protein PMAYCL1PPCAC_07315, partial [Pristionchus mayeri]
MDIGGLFSSPVFLLLSLYSLLPFLSLLTTVMFCCFRPREPQGDHPTIAPSTSSQSYVTAQSESCCTTWSSMATEDLRRGDRTVTEQPSSSSEPTVVHYTPNRAPFKASKDGYQARQ